jgi:hypothetical protein
MIRLILAIWELIIIVQGDVGEEVRMEPDFSESCTLGVQGKGCLLAFSIV